MAEVGLYSAVVAALCAMVSSIPVPSEESSKINLFMPGVQPQVDDTYLCYPHKLSDETEYITGFEPHANMSTAHHMLVYGCTEPGQETGTWNCGEMMTKDENSGPICKEGAKIIYAWAMDAPELKLPEGVGFKVGGDSSIKYLVLQVHYKDVTPFVAPNDNKDKSGIAITVTDEPQPKLAGVYLLGTNGEIPAHETVYMETACSYNDQAVLHPFAFRTHAHSHGRVVSGYRVRDGKWTEIGRKSPQDPQMFYKVSNPGMDVEPGDMLAARCTMVNNDNHTINIGATQNDEMCNFYIMYWTESSKPLQSDYCFSAGPPSWNWKDDPLLDAMNAPLDASIIPGTDELLKATSDFVGDMDDSIEKIINEFRLAEEQGYGVEDEPEQYYQEYPYQREPEYDQNEYLENEIMNDMRDYPELVETLDRAIRAEQEEQEYRDFLENYFGQQ